MEQTEIKRIALKRVEVPSTLPSLKEEALEVLGYNPDSQVEREKGSPVEEALRELEIEILDWKDVKRYQLEQRQKKEWDVLATELAQDSPAHWPSTVEWRRTEIEKYKGWIPDHVLLKAIQIRRRLPGVELFVEHLEETRDPFLVIEEKGANSWDRSYFWVEVWNEPGYESAR